MPVAEPVRNQDAGAIPATNNPTPKGNTMMKPLRLAALLMILPAALAGCEDDEDDIVYRANLTGANEVPARTTTATGTALFRLNENRTTITYTVDVVNLSNITAGHIHGPADAATNAGVIIGLFTTPPAASPFTGRLAEGTITASSSLSGVDFAGLLQLFETGMTYVNIHSSDGVEPPNTGAGDFPGGEIRGQILRQ
jgi:hypothetical protein